MVSKRILTPLILLLVLAIGMLTVPVQPMKTQSTDDIISKLQQLHSSLRNEHPPLQNKVAAVIHQIEAGALNGALNKLENDVKGSVMAKVDDPQDLIELIDEIINLIKGIVPPPPPIPDFSIAASPSLLSIQQGDSNSSVVTIASIRGFSQSVTLAITSDPLPGITATLDPTQVVPLPDVDAISIFAVEVDTEAVIGSYDVTVTANSNALEHSINITLKITAPPTPPGPDFSINAVPDSLIIEQGGSDTASIIVVSHRGFSKQVNLTIISMPITGVAITLDPSQVTPDPDGFSVATLEVAVAYTATADDHIVTVLGNASDGTITRSTTISLRITAEKTPPEISGVSRLPEIPSYNESVIVSASVVDSESGLKVVVLNYSAGSEWTAVDMSLVEGLYQAGIPAFPFNSTIKYYVEAIDNANNNALSDLYFYTVIDPYQPVLRIESPEHGGYLAGTVPIIVFMKDQNGGGESGFAGANLTINGEVVMTWKPPAPSEPTTYQWNTAAFGPDGNYILEVIVLDKAGNMAQKSIKVIVDNTAPSAEIEAPTNGSYIRLTTPIEVIGNDANFDKMQILVDDELVKSSTISGTETVEWNTQSYADGVHGITLVVSDKAGNSKQVVISVLVDNTPPVIGAPTWSPSEPEANSEIQINVTVTESSQGSGVSSVNLMFRNKTMEEWLVVPMQFKDGNWTAFMYNQSDTVVTFLVEAFDKAGNREETEEPFEFAVAAPYVVPLAWILAAIIAIAAVIGGSSYYVRKKQRKSETAPPSSAASS